MNRSFVFTPNAEEDALEIWLYLADDADERTADRVIARVYDECQKLGENPGLGHYREELLGKDYRFWSVWSYVIAYRWQVKPIQVIAVVHGARNLEAFFGRRTK